MADSLSSFPFQNIQDESKGKFVLILRYSILNVWESLFDLYQFTSTFMLVPSSHFYFFPTF